MWECSVLPLFSDVRGSELRVLAALPPFCSTAFAPRQLITSAPLNVPQRLWSKHSETRVVGAALSRNKATVVWCVVPPLLWLYVMRKQDPTVGPKPPHHPRRLVWKQWCLSQTSPDPHLPACFIKVFIVQLNGLHRYCHHHFPPFSRRNRNITSSQYTPSWPTGRGFLGHCCCLWVLTALFRIQNNN